ncbi:S-layer homology domain-containing protein [Natranaerobius thermophilus]|uniref:SLH domain-containing protein n=1 Tax=Natranaerobius thermophilus (strain ATCC BAA-1301 / DSM 18059 / JW/NM-WN-LF) TaxID=457570 RepID=B2A850_NATTJ|nr:S-layer homology domain-containing protein [Natranaerobius thermophilus]ACB85818.1 hypothetical protein Nther_2252 [Natranaerobius thermophilus JW/NM-WN-LF]
MRRIITVSSKLSPRNNSRLGLILATMAIWLIVGSFFGLGNQTFAAEPELEEVVEEAPNAVEKETVEEEQEPDKSDELDQELTRVDDKIRSKLDILDGYRLDDVDEYREEGHKRFKYQDDNHSISVVYNLENERIVRLDSHVPRREPTLAQITTAEAKEKAIDYLKKLYPDLLDQGYLDPEPIINRRIDDERSYNSYYQFEFSRQYNDIPVKGEGITIVINAINGELFSINKDFTDVDRFVPVKDKAIKAEKAMEIFKEQLPLQLVYMNNARNTELDSGKLYFTFFGQVDVDSRGYLNRGYSVDVNEGELVTNFEQIEHENIAETLTQDGRLTDKFLEQYAIELQGETPPDQKEIDEDYTADRGKEFLHYLGIEDVELDRTSIRSIRRPIVERAEAREVYEMTFSHEEIRSLRHLRVKACTESGDIIGFEFRPRGEAQLLELVGDRPERLDLSEISQDLVENMRPKPSQDKKLLDSWNLTVTQDADEPHEHQIVEDPGEHEPGRTFRGAELIRIIDNIPVEASGYHVMLDQATGFLNTLRTADIDRESLQDPEEVNMSKQDAREQLLSELDIEITYAPKTISEEGELVTDVRQIAEEDVKYEMRPVYQLKPYVQQIDRLSSAPYIEAETGEVYRYDGSPFIEEDIFQLVDDDHWAATYLELGLAQGMLPLREGQLHSDADITKEELSVMLAYLISVQDTGYGPDIPEEPYFNNVHKNHPKFDEIQLTADEGIFDKDQDRFPADEKVTREEMAQLIIKTLDLELLMHNDLTFSMDYQDQDEISPELRDYVGLVTGLGIMNGDGQEFSPQEKLSRAEAITILYQLDEELGDMKN